ncbi:hypothetical protein HK405_011328, partial [Cladochytrium tenue]
TVSDYSWRSPAVVLNETGEPMKLGIDSHYRGNMARFVNDVADPNCEAVFFPYRELWRVVYVSMRPISAGEEVTVSYGPKYWESRPNKKQQPPHFIRLYFSELVRRSDARVDQWRFPYIRRQPAFANVIRDKLSGYCFGSARAIIVYDGGSAPAGKRQRRSRAKKFWRPVVRACNDVAMPVLVVSSKADSLAMDNQQSLGAGSSAGVLEGLDELAVSAATGANIDLVKLWMTRAATGPEERTLKLQNTTALLKKYMKQSEDELMLAAQTYDMVRRRLATATPKKIKSSKPAGGAVDGNASSSKAGGGGGGGDGSQKKDKNRK